MDNPVVTVICLTYNHEKFVAQALDSFVSQITTFPFEVIVIDDCSVDSNYEIARSYASEYPNIIMLIKHHENLGANRALEEAMSLVKGKFIAFCEGDDYWTDPHKLQKQYDYLVAHPNMRGVFCDTEIKIETQDGTWVYEEDYNNNSVDGLHWPLGRKKFVWKEQYSIEDFYDLWMLGHISTLMIRNDFEIVFPSWFFDINFGDMVICALSFLDGFVGFIPETVGVYRRHEKGVAYLTSREQKWIDNGPDRIKFDTEMLKFYKEENFRDSIHDSLFARFKTDLRLYLKGIMKLRNNKSLRCATRKYNREIRVAWSLSPFTRLSTTRIKALVEKKPYKNKFRKFAGRVRGRLRRHIRYIAQP